MKPNAILNIIVALLKHQLKQAIGDEVIEIVTQEFADLGADELNKQIDSWLGIRDVQHELMRAAERADDCFRQASVDQDLVEWMVSLPLAKLPKLHKALLSLPDQADETELKDTLRDVISREWKGLDPYLINQSIEVYLSCLRKNLLPIKSQTLQIIGRSILRTEKEIRQLHEQVSAIPVRIEERLRVIPTVPDEYLVRTYLQHVASQAVDNLRSETYLPRQIVPVSQGFFPRFATSYVVGQYQHEYHEKDTFPLEEIISRQPKLILLGEPGIGKTTSLQHLAKVTAKKALQHESLIPIPIYAELKTYRGEPIDLWLAERFEGILLSGGRSMGSTPYERSVIFNNWIKTEGSNFVLLLDGINEVQPEHYSLIQERLKAWLSYAPRMVISCRERDYDQNFWDKTKVFVIEGLQKNEIYNYLSETLGARGEGLFAEQIDNYKMLSLTRNPLMLWLVAVVAQEDPHVRLPVNRGRLFQRFKEIMPRLRASEGAVFLHPAAIIARTLSRLGYEMQTRRRLTIDLGEAIDWVTPNEGVSVQDIFSQAKDWRFLKSDGRKGEPVEFLHPLFQEYFAAEYLRLRLQSQKDYAKNLGSIAFSYNWIEVIEMLAGICDDPSGLVRWLASEVMEKKRWRDAGLLRRCWKASQAISDRSILGTVINVLLAERSSKSYWVNTAIFEELNEIGEDPCTWLTDSLNHEVELVRIGAVEELGIIGDDRAIEPLIITLDDKSESVRAETAKAFGKLKSSRAVVPLINVLQDEGNEVRRFAAEALGEIGDSLAIDPLITILDDSDYSVSYSAINALSKIGGSAIEPLAEALSSANPNVRWGAANALSRLGDQKVIKYLIRASDDSCADVRASIAETLGQFDSDHVIETLASLLDDPDVNVRCCAVESLGNIGDIKTVGQLGFAIYDREVDVRKSAIEALAKIRSKKSLHFLSNALKDSDVDVQVRAVEALKDLGDSRAIEPLIHHLVEADAEVCYFITNALLNFGKDVIDPLIDLLKNGLISDEARASVAWLIGEIGDFSVLPELERMAFEDWGSSYRYGSVAITAQASIKKIQYY